MSRLREGSWAPRSDAPSMQALLGMLKCEQAIPAGQPLLYPGSSVPLANHALLELIVDSELLVRRLQAVQVQAVAQLVQQTAPARRRERRAGQATPPDQQIAPSRLVAALVAPELTLSRKQAGHLTASAVGLLHDLPDIHALLRAGRLDWARAKLITDKLHHPFRTPDWFRPGCAEWSLIQAALVAQAPGTSYRALEDLIDRLLLGLAPDDANARHVRARRDRRIDVGALPDGMASLFGILDADAAQVLDGALDVLADAARDEAAAQGRPDTRTHEQRRADVFAAVFQAAADGLDLPLARDPRQSEDPCDGAAGEMRSEQGPGQNYEPGQCHEPGRDQGQGQGNGPDHEPDRDRSRDHEPDQKLSHEPGQEPPGQRPDERPGERRSEHPGQRSGPEPGTAAPPHDDARSGGRPADPPTTNCPTCQQRATEELVAAQERARHQSLAEYGLKPVPAGRIPAVWRLPALPRKRGSGPHLVVTITDATLLGLDNTPGLLQGHGTIPAALARKLAATAGRITLVPLPTSTGSAAGGRRTDPCPYGFDHQAPSAHRYRPSSALIDQVTARHQTCTFPGCFTPARRCDIDHVIPFEQGGATCVCNLQVACRSDHRLKTFAGWAPRFSRPDEPYPQGTVIWTSPQGAEHAGPPTELPGTPAWNLPRPRSSASTAPEPGLPEPDSPEPAERLIMSDTLPSTQRTTARLTRWQRGIQRENDRADRDRARGRGRGRGWGWGWGRKKPRTGAGGRTKARRKNQTAPWGPGTGLLPGREEPPF